MGPKEASRHPWIVGEEVANAMMASPLVHTPRGSQTEQDLADAVHEQLLISGSATGTNGGSSSSGAPAASAAMSRVLHLASDEPVVAARLKTSTGSSPSVAARDSPSTAAATAAAAAAPPPPPTGPAPTAPAPAPAPASATTHSRLGSFFSRHKFGMSNSPSTA